PSAPRAAATGALGLFTALARNRAGLIGFIVFALFVLVAFIGPFFVPQTLATDVRAIYQAPSMQHPLGTDSEGRDIVIQMINGGQSIILVGATAALISTLISITLRRVGRLPGRIRRHDHHAGCRRRANPAADRAASRAGYLHPSEQPMAAGGHHRALELANIVARCPRSGVVAKG